MKCAFCAYDFKEEDAYSSCSGCPLKRSCALLRCPACGYENTPEPGLIKLLRKRRNRSKEESFS